ncbi:cyclic nucleotide-binding domain-containing protein [Candidatus Peregrinibacteria bacterium]|jgi:CRP-like cAMP-binding protein|nr:cyclic nucleotide-binding domain-containing protein [Candidatus Peregrinibacteria bacterium]MBT7736228.1 cyclic nucleotide-binding domain-containing protein [Candidatus Peregrinibacteria bacterium]
MPNDTVDSTMLIPILKKIPLFANLDENLHKEIIEHIVLMYYPSEYVVFNEKDDGDALYIVKQGQIQIFHPPKEEGDLPTKVADINQGGFFGEMALVSDEKRSASARTTMDSEVFILSKEDFKKLLDTNTALAEQISATVVSRINENAQ